MTLKSDVRLARTYGPLVARTLTANIAELAHFKMAPKVVPRGVQVTDFDPFDPVTAADPYPGYRQLLTEGPVHYSPRRGIFMLSRHADVRAAARADDVMSSAEGVTMGRIELPVLLTSDRPAHTRMRKQVQPAFTRGALESWRPMVDQLARELVTELVTRQRADVVETLAAPMPLRMIAHIMGVPAGDEKSFRHWSNNTVHVANIDISRRGLMQFVPTLSGFRHLHAYFTDQLPMLNADTVLGTLVQHAQDGQVSHEELFFFAVLLLLAGNETTTNLLSTLFLTLAEQPDQLALLQSRPELIPSAIEEQLRYRSPIQSFFRTARADYRVGDETIPAGARVLLIWGAANRDPREYDDPDTFRADRNPTGHLAFGSGIHLCLGAQLARMEAQAVLRELVQNVERIEVTGTPTWSTNPNLRGLTRLNVRMTRRLG
jgi:beta-dihydromenaquinone-9 omega-hydroxylase